MKSKLLALALGAAFSVGAFAIPTVDLTYYAGYNGVAKIKLTGYENFTSGLVVGSQNYGVLKVTSIQDNNGNLMWFDGKNGTEISGVFSSIELTTATAPDLFGTVSLAAKGGLGSFYANAAGSFTTAGGFSQGALGFSDLGCAVNTLCYDGVTNAAVGGKLFDANWVGGVLDAFANTTTTVFGSLNLVTGKGSAGGYMSVVAGSGPEAIKWNTDGFTFVNNPKADLLAENRFCSVGFQGCNTAADGGNFWAFAIEDPITGKPLPEPGSMALVGLGLLGVAAIRRRRNV